MKTAVIVAPSFAPSSYPPAIRVRFFASHLREFGWRPIVMTVRPEFLEEPQDPTFSSLVPSDLEVIRTPAIPQRLTRRLKFGDLGLRSFPYLLRGLNKLCREGVDALLIPGPPWYPFCLGPIIRRRFGVPYVLDYIDPWVDSVGAQARWPSKAWAAHRLAVLLERSAVINASAFISVSEGTNETIRSRYPTISSHFTAIPYGFEPNDFAAVRQQEQSSKYLAHFRDNLNFCYVGAMLPKAYDTVRALFRAVAQLRASSHEAERIRLHFFGTTYATGAAAKPLVLSVAEEEGIADVVTEHPERIPYLEALRVLVSADMVLALGSSETHYTASKIFPNLLARRPLLAMFHEASSVCDIIRLARTGHLITFNDRQPVGTKVDKIADAIGSFLQGDSIGLDELGVEEVSQRFSAREMTRLLADVLNKAISSQPNDLMEGVLTEGGIS